ncbi:hypothetical protein KBC89_00920 [Candidatus Woesebacteria bacterium]|nr:hypothetical protein [Candidatus Woesebacteria bacterium]
MGEISKTTRLEDLLNSDTFLNEINDAPLSEKDVTWSDKIVVVVLRTKEEIRRAQLLELNPVGTTLVILRKNSHGTTIHTDEVIRRALQIIKGNEAH